MISFILAAAEGIIALFGLPREYPAMKAAAL